MNYYPFHLGDYAAHTGHLEPLEDLAYRRLLDQYYLREGPLPADIPTTAKLVRMRANVVEVEAVLREFFTLGEAGWSHVRCDEEIKNMQEKQEASEERDEHEKTRMQKHRERRSAMFAQLSEVGVYPAWNAKTGELERLIEAHCGKPVTPAAHSAVTAPVTAPVTQDTQPASLLQRPATAIPTPTPTPKSISCSDLLTESEPMSAFAIPLVDNTDFEVPERLVGEWVKAYPAVDVPQELREMRTWSMANKPKRKTRRGVEAFIVKWLGKAQDTPSRNVGQRGGGADDWTGRAT